MNELEETKFDNKEYLVVVVIDLVIDKMRVGQR